jgi:hypothetical protein
MMRPSEIIAVLVVTAFCLTAWFAGRAGDAMAVAGFVLALLLSTSTRGSRSERPRVSRAFMVIASLAAINLLLYLAFGKGGGLAFL